MRELEDKENGNKKPVQFRIGALLLQRIDASVLKSNCSRNEWVERAVALIAERDGIPARLRITAAELLGDKKTIMVRLDPFLVSTIDEFCKDQKFKRTILLLDACMTKLATEERDNV